MEEFTYPIELQQVSLVSKNAFVTLRPALAREGRALPKRFSRPGNDPSASYVSLVFFQQPRMHLSTSSKPPIGGYLTLFKLLVASLLREVRAAPALASRSSGWTSGAGVGAAGAGAMLWKRADEELSSQGELQD